MSCSSIGHTKPTCPIVRDCGSTVKEDGFLSAVASTRQLKETDVSRQETVSGLIGVEWVQLAGHFVDAGGVTKCICVCHRDRLDGRGNKKGAGVVVITSFALKCWFEGRPRQRSTLFVMSLLDVCKVLETCGKFPA